MRDNKAHVFWNLAEWTPRGGGQPRLDPGRVGSIIPSKTGLQTNVTSASSEYMMNTYTISDNVQSRCRQYQGNIRLQYSKGEWPCELAKQIRKQVQLFGMYRLVPLINLTSHSTRPSTYTFPFLSSLTSCLFAPAAGRPGTTNKSLMDSLYT